MYRSKDLFKKRREFFKLSSLLSWYIKAPVIINSIPKSGTNLLMNMCLEMPEYRRNFRPTINETNVKRKYILRRNCIHMFHLTYDELQKVEIHSAVRPIQIFLYRDFRDIALSTIDYIEKIDKGHRLSSKLGSAESLNEKVAVLIETNDFSSKGRTFIEEHLAYFPFLNDSRWVALSYEDIVNEQSSNGFVDLAHIDRRFKGRIDLNNLYSRTKNIGRSSRFLRESGEVQETLENYLGKLLNKFGYSR